MKFQVVFQIVCSAGRNCESFKICSQVLYSHFIKKWPLYPLFPFVLCLETCSVVIRQHRICIVWTPSYLLYWWFTPKDIQLLMSACVVWWSWAAVRRPYLAALVGMPATRAVVLNPWVITLLRVEWTFLEGHLSPPENANTYIIIHNSRKL